MTTTNKTWERAEIDAMILLNPRAAERAMVVLHDRQTEDEQQVRHTRWLNKRGFAVWAAKAGSKLAETVKAGGKLAGDDLKMAERIALYHSKQLVEAANARLAAAVSA